MGINYRHPPFSHGSGSYLECFHLYTRTVMLAFHEAVKILIRIQSSLFIHSAFTHSVSTGYKASIIQGAFIFIKLYLGV